MNPYLQGQDLRDMVGDTKVNPLEEVVALKNQNVQAGKVMFAIKTTVDEMLDRITIVEMPKKAWDTQCTSLFLKKNDTRLQLLENELLSIAQSEMTINKYVIKVKALYHEICELDSTSII